MCFLAWITSQLCECHGRDYRWMEYPGVGYDVRHPHDGSVMTYRGHSVLRTLMRAYWSPAHSTGQRYLYTGTLDGAIVVYGGPCDLFRPPFREGGWRPGCCSIAVCTCSTPCGMPWLWMFRQNTTLSGVHLLQSMSLASLPVLARLYSSISACGGCVSGPATIRRQGFRQLSRPHQMLRAWGLHQPKQPCCH